MSDRWSAAIWGVVLLVALWQGSGLWTLIGCGGIILTAWWGWEDRRRQRRDDSAAFRDYRRRKETRK
jgi:hypothetical protein